MIKRVINWLKQLVNQRDHLIEANEAFLDVQRGVASVKSLERVLVKLCGKKMYIFIPDWGDYEKDQYCALKIRLNKAVKHPVH